MLLARACHSTSPLAWRFYASGYKLRLQSCQKPQDSQPTTDFVRNGGIDIRRRLYGSGGGFRTRPLAPTIFHNFKKRSGRSVLWGAWGIELTLKPRCFNLGKIMKNKASATCAGPTQRLDVTEIILQEQRKAPTITKQSGLV
jgi:hypothetical protein